MLFQSERPLAVFSSKKFLLTRIISWLEVHIIAIATFYFKNFSFFFTLNKVKKFTSGKTRVRKGKILFCLIFFLSNHMIRQFGIINRLFKSEYILSKKILFTQQYWVILFYSQVKKVMLGETYTFNNTSNDEIQTEIWA